jgi:transposase
MKSITENQREQIIGLLNSGETIREVSRRVKVGVATVSRVGNHYCSARNRQKEGRPAVLTEADKRYCVRQVTKGGVNNADKVKRALETDLGIQVRASTVRRALRGAGLGAMAKPRKPLISAKNARKRLAWCKAHADWTVDDWRRVVWSDETKINRFNSDGRVWAWIRDGESLKPKYVKVTVKHGGGSIMLWSAITYAGVGWLCKIDGNMDKELYKEILEDDQSKTIDYTREKLGLRRDQLIFQHDNDPKHTSKISSTKS